MTYALIDSPVGPLTLVERSGALAGVYLTEHRHQPPLEGDRDDQVLPAVQEQLAAYFAGQLTTFDLPLSVGGTAFQQQVWTALSTIPYGVTWTYRQLAEAIGNPRAVRAVGLANGRNPVSIVVPCHRVVGADGSLTGYGGGLERKQWLLEHERRLPEAQRLPARGA